MKIKIENDVFEISKRIKEFDEDYYIMFDTKKEVFELHNSSQPFSFCLTIPYGVLDCRVIDMILYTNIANIDNIMRDIDNNNIVIENNNTKELKDRSDYMVKEIYDFSSNSSKEYKINSLSNLWR